MLGVVACLAYALWHLQVGWSWALLSGVLLMVLGSIGFTMVVRSPQAVLWVEDETLCWKEESCLPFQQAQKGSVPVSDITHVQSTLTPLAESFHHELVITDSGGARHLLPPNLSFLTRGQRLHQLLAALRSRKPTITFAETVEP